LSGDLSDELKSFWGEERHNFLIIGVGRRVRGDESGGLLVTERLREIIGGERVVVAEDRPENYTELIRQIGPSRILYVMAAKSGGSPGDTRLIRLEKHESVHLHESPLTTLNHFLSGLMGSETRLLLIEPKSLMGEESPGMVRTVRIIAEEIAESLRS
jgi:hydrogenase maturation protease